ncbi:MAG: biotin/lipoyl-containing protein [Bacillota bacterium]
MSTAQTNHKRIEVKAPIAGVFYRRPSPEDPPYVEVGDLVKKKQVLCLLETMKVFQKIKAPVDGRVIEIVAQNEKPVADNDVLMILECD